MDMNELNSQITEEQISEMDGKFLTFFTDGQLFGVPISDVVQIVGLQEITPIPEFPDYAKGIINLRGSIIPVIDIRLRLGKEPCEYNERTCIIVTNVNENYVGFIVDGVDEVADIDTNNVSDLPKMKNAAEDTYLTGIAKLDKRVVLLLNTEKVLSEDVVELITSDDILGGIQDV